VAACGQSGGWGSSSPASLASINAPAMPCPVVASVTRPEKAGSGVEVAVGEGVRVGVVVLVGVDVAVAVAVGVEVGVSVRVAVAVLVRVGAAVGVAVGGMGVGVAHPIASMKISTVSIVCFSGFTWLMSPPPEIRGLRSDVESTSCLAVSMPRHPALTERRAMQDESPPTDVL